MREFITFQFINSFIHRSKCINFVPIMYQVIFQGAMKNSFMVASLRSLGEELDEQTDRMTLDRCSDGTCGHHT